MVSFGSVTTDLPEVSGFAWDFGDGNTSTDYNPTHTYADDGAYTVSLTVYGPGGTDTGSRTVSVSATPPAAAFTATPDPAGVGQTVSFSNASTSPNSLMSFQWDFGNGHTSSDASPSFVYTAAGTFAVTLTVTDNYGQSDTAMQTLVVSATPPAAAFSVSPTPAGVGQTLTFNNTSTSPNSLMSFAWDFGNGGTSSDSSPTYVYSAAGTFVVSLTVTDQYGQSDTVTQSLTVSATPPTAAFTATPSPAGVGQAVSFGNTSTSPNSLMSFQWDFGNGQTSSDASPTYVYGSPGTYTVTLTVTDQYGQSDTEAHTLTVDPTPPAAAFNVTPTPAGVGQTLTFSNTSTSPNSLMRFAWDFGNGGTSSDSSPSFVYTAAGTYTVTLTVTDQYGQSDTETQTLTVAATPPTAAFTATPDPAGVGWAVAFGDTSESPNGLMSWAWDFGDGNTSTSQSPIHTYTAAGVYTVTLTVTDYYGQSDVETRALAVAATPPTAGFAVTPSPAGVGQTLSFNNTSTSPNSLMSFAWDFGNGSTSTDSSPTFVYTAAGTYTVTLTVTDQYGQSDTTTQTLAVAATPPTAAFSFLPAAPAAGGAVAFADGSSSPNGMLSYAWQFGAGGPTSGDQNPTFAFADPGVYAVTLTVTDQYGQSASTTQTVAVVPADGGAAWLESYGYDWTAVDASLSGQSLPLTALSFVYDGVAYGLADAVPNTAVASYANGVFTGAAFSLAAKGGNRPLTVTLAEHAVAGGTEWRLTGTDDTPAPNNVGQLFQVAADVVPTATFDFSKITLPGPNPPAGTPREYEIIVEVYGGINLMSRSVAFVDNQSTVKKVRDALYLSLQRQSILVNAQEDNWLTVKYHDNSPVTRVDIKIVKPDGTTVVKPRLHSLDSVIKVKYDGTDTLPWGPP